MAASHFFVGLSAGVALLSVPVLLFTPARDVPGQMAAWIAGPGPQAQAQRTQADVINRPTRGFVPGQPTPAEAAPPPTLTAVKPTATPRPQSQAAQAPQVQPIAAMPAGGLRTGVIRAHGQPVTVRKVAGVDSPDDPTIADKAPVLVSSGAELTISGQTWRAVRGLNGIAGWVPSAQVAIDGEPAPPPQLQQQQQEQREKVANTSGVGVALRRTPNDADKLGRALTENTQVLVLERQGADWAHVRADNGAEGWVPAQYLAPLS